MRISDKLISQQEQVDYVVGRWSGKLDPLPDPGLTHKMESAHHRAMGGLWGEALT